jgi:hypothetical protein
MFVPFLDLLAEFSHNDGCVDDLTNAITDNVQSLCKEFPQTSLSKEIVEALILGVCQWERDDLVELTESYGVRLQYCLELVKENGTSPKDTMKALAVLLARTFERVGAQEVHAIPRQLHHRVPSEQRPDRYLQVASTSCQQRHFITSINLHL